MDVLSSYVLVWHTCSRLSPSTLSVSQEAETLNPEILEYSRDPEMVLNQKLRGLPRTVIVVHVYVSRARRHALQVPLPTSIHVIDDPPRHTDYELWRPQIYLRSLRAPRRCPLLTSGRQRCTAARMLVPG